MKLPEIIFFCMFMFLFSLTGCSLPKSENQLSSSMPKDFNFVFNYGVGAKNQLDTSKGQYTKDMVIEPSITASLKLTNEEMNKIYEEMKKINILTYPDNFSPKTNMMQTPFYTYSIKIIADGREKNIFWEDQYAAKTKDAVQLRKLFNKIIEILINKDEFKKLPGAKGGYD
jgi:hypothetical protein